MATVHPDRSQSGGDLNWPINYPAEVLLSFQPVRDASGRLPQGVMAVTASQKLKITSKVQGSTINGVACTFAYAVTSGPNAESGLVPVTVGSANVLKIGTRARLDEPLFIDIPRDPALRIDWSDTVFTLTGRLPRTVWSLIDQFYAHREDIGNYNSRMDSLSTRNNRMQVFLEFMAAYNRVTTRTSYSMAQTLDVDFSIRKLLDISFGVVSGDDSRLRTIYLLAHYDFEGKLYLIEIYIGRSIKPGLRLKSHNAAKHDPRYAKSNHYKLARNARTTTMIPLMQFEGDTKWLFLAEQINLCLFHAYCPAVLNLGLGDGAFADSDEKRLHKWAEYSLDSRAARQVTTIADAVFLKTGWPLLIRRGDPGNDTVAIKAGGNWKSPIIELCYEKVRYSVTTLAGLGKVFRRPPLTCPFKGHTTYHYDNDLHTDTLPYNLVPDGTQYYVSFELTANGKPHPNAYARLPLYLGMNNRDQAMSWAIRIEWREDTQWYMSYAYHGQPGRLIENTPCAFNSYQIGIRTYHWLRQEIMSIPDYMEFLGRPGTGIRLTTVDLDHASRIVTVRDAADAVPLPTQDGPRYSSIQEMYDLLATISDDNTAFGARTNNLARCDGCRIENQECYHDADTHQFSCTNCTFYNRFCTWTPDLHLAGSELEQAYLSPGLTSQKVPISDPGYESVDIDEIYNAMDDEGILLSS